MIWCEDAGSFTNEHMICTHRSSLPTISQSSTLPVHSFVLILSEYSLLMGIGTTVTSSRKLTRFLSPEPSEFRRSRRCTSSSFSLYRSGALNRGTLRRSRVVLSGADNSVLLLGVVAAAFLMTMIGEVVRTMPILWR